MASKEQANSETKLELKRYKDLLSMREKEIAQLKDRSEQQRNNDIGLKKRVDQLEKEKTELKQ